MNKNEAIKRLYDDRIKISHTLFLPGEFLQIIGEELCDANGLPMDAADFWAQRSGDKWATGWYNYNGSRPSGYYWVRFNGSDGWVISEYNETYNTWSYKNDCDGNDSQFEEIQLPALIPPANV